VDNLRELWQNMDTLVQKHGIKTKGLPIEIEGKTMAPVTQQPTPPPGQPVQQVSVVVPIVTPQQPQQQQPPQVTITRCPYCGATITQPAKFCPNCGSALQ